MSVKFDSEFIDRRMAEHKRWQHDVLNELLYEAMGEMAEALSTPAFKGFAQRAKARSFDFGDAEKIA